MVVFHLKQEKLPLCLNLKKQTDKKKEEVNSMNATTHTNTQEEAFSAQGNVSG